MTDEAPAPGNTTTLAVLFADVAGSTRLYEQVGDSRALAAINACLALVKSVAEGHQGRIIKNIGDEAMAVFPSADLAAEAAAEIQGRIAKLAPVGTQNLAMRIGFHVGPAIESEGDVYGDSVNVAARMVGLAKGGQVIMSEWTSNALSSWLRARTRQLDAMTVKGKVQDIGIFELVCVGEDELTAVSTRLQAPPARIRLQHGTRDIALGPEDSAISLGRDPQCDVVITDRLASRSHARIERRRDKFVLIDQSTNGTFVTFEGEPEIQLRREELVLRGRGHVAFGHSHKTDPGEVVHFVCGG
ncbi:MAG TPA: adenylate/guanylate cyclase domain-containing protein [Casimicrobiaceae bacterium]|nr:adenylate/guanylate cyclase domain-containing protein [Casimicrobiaceae bacterium]